MNRKRKIKVINMAALVMAVIIAIILAAAAYGKLFFPSQKLMALDVFAAIFEFVFIVALLCLFRESLMWLFSMIVFATWAGFSIYWLTVGQPCSCMGTMVEIPSKFYLACDVIFFAGSTALSYLLGAGKKTVLVFLVLGLISGFLGYHLAKFA